VTASVLHFRRPTQRHGLIVDDLDRLLLGAEYLPGQWRLDVSTESAGTDEARVWLRPQNRERAMFADIGFNRVAGIVWVTTKHSEHRSGAPFGTIDAAIHLLCAIMSSDEAIGPSQHPGLQGKEPEAELALKFEAATSPRSAATTNPSRLNVTPTPLGSSTCSANIHPSECRAILWFDPRREHSSVPTAKSRRRRAQGLSRLAAPFAATRRAWP
jgi:hypothetical protein